jgi:hypothetical protein
MSKKGMEMNYLLSGFSFLSAIWLVFILGVSGSAEAIPFAKYSVSGSLVKGFPGADPNDLSGATYESIYIFDMMSTPVVRSAGIGSVIASHSEDMIKVNISNRPNAAQDFSFLASAVDSAITYNYFSPSLSLDEIVLGHLAYSVTTTPLGSIQLPLIMITFNDQSIIPGPGAGPLPSFDMSDVSSMNSGALMLNDYGFFGRYRLNVSNIQGVYIPEPSSLLLLAAGLIGLYMNNNRQRQNKVVANPVFD